MLNTRPTGDRTGYSNPRCYAHTLGDCSQQISREHYISEKLLRRIGTDGIVVSGLSWMKEPRKLSYAALTAKVLCTRHNNALSPLDDRITDLYDSVWQWYSGQDAAHRVLDGEDIERWAIKLWLGFYVSGNATMRGLKARARVVPEPYLRVLFGEQQIQDGAGLFFVSRLPVPRADVKLAFFSVHFGDDDPDAGQMFGITIDMLGFAFVTTVLSGMKTNPPYRPREVVFDSGGSLQFRWARRPNGPTIDFTKEAIERAEERT